MTILFVQAVCTTLATLTVVNTRRWQLVTLALFTKLFQFKANDARFQLIQNLNPNLVLWVKNTAFASNSLAMSKVFVKATFVSGTFDGKSLSLELPLFSLPPSLLMPRGFFLTFALLFIHSQDSYLDQNVPFIDQFYFG